MSDKINSLISLMLSVYKSLGPSIYDVHTDGGGGVRLR